ncbi:MAG: ABC transporter ATP-binding protein [Chloroflexota bacterium]
MKQILNGTRTTFAAIIQMVKLAWEAHRVIFAGLILLTIVQAFIPLGTAWITKLIFDNLAALLQGTQSVPFMQIFAPLIIIQALLLLFNKVLQPINNYLNAELSRQLTVILPTRIYKKLNSFAGIAYFETPDFHDVLRLSQEGAQHGTLTLVSTLTHLIQGIITLIIFLGVLLTLGWVVALLVALVAIPQLIVQLRFGGQRFNLAYELSPDERRSFYYSFILSRPEMTKEIRLFGLGDHLIDRLVQTYHKVNHAKRKQDVRELRWETGLELLAVMVSSGAFLFIVMWAFQGRLTIGDVTLYNNAITSVQGALYSLVFGISQLHMHALFFSHYQRLMSLPQPIPITHAPVSTPPLRRGIEFHNVSFRYTDKHPWVLQNIDLHIPAGKSIALVGINGAGKSTMVKLLTRLYDPTEGYITWDGIDIREFCPSALRQRIGAIFQDFMRYELTVHENIGFGNLDKMDDRNWVQHAAKQANVHTDITKLPHGYDTELSRMFAEMDKGIDLSGGQWQKVATARMFTRDADLLILDEPTAALDAESEYDTYHHFTELVENRTSVLISHRFSTVRMADMIAVIEHGRITEYGSHEVLMLANGTYARLYKMQAENYTLEPSL